MSDTSDKDPSLYPLDPNVDPEADEVDEDGDDGDDEAKARRRERSE